MNKNLVKFGALATALAPFAVFAQEDIIVTIQDILGSVVSILMTVAVIYFIWGLIKYIQAAAKGDKEEAAHGKAIMIWGIVALFVMASIWGLVSALGSTVGIDPGESIDNVVDPNDLIPSN